MENEKAYTRFNSYIEGLKDISVTEQFEGGSEVEQCRYFMDLLVSKPEIKVVLEIGFNTGISAAYFLSSRDDVYVISVDIGEHKYVNECKKLINTHFPGRHTLLIGDSKKVIPELIALKQIVPDLIFIDGDHIAPTPLIDARNCLAMGHKDTIYVMDDTNLINGWAGVLDAMCELVKKKEIDTSRVICQHFRRSAWTLFWKAPA
jgi:predicted O-methyltransferase YrrM